MKLSHYYQLNFILFSFFKIASAAISCSSIITGLKLKNTKCLLEIQDTKYLTNNVTIKLPNNCDQDIHKQDNDALGGTNCDFSQPIIIKYTENKYYISKVFVQSYQWYLQACPQSLQTLLSVNSAQQKQLTLNNDSDEYNSIPMCDFRNDIMQLDNVNSQSIEIDYILNQTSSIGQNCLEYLVVIIQTCPQNCSSCDHSSLNCLTCIDTYFLYPDNTCQKCQQSSGFFISGIKCLACDKICQTCSGSLSNNCLSCYQDFYLFDDNTCQKYCDTQNGFVISNNNCKACGSFCKTCQIQGDSSINCLTCLDGKYLLPNKTCNTCKIDQGFYVDGKNCLPCHNTCKTCSNSEINNCLSCDSGSYLFDDNQGYYIDGKNCLPCHNTCKTCSNSEINNCLSCDLGSYLFEDNTCKSSCDTLNGFFILGLNCKKCDSLCKTCQVNKNYCLSCKDGYILKNNKCEQIYISYGSKTFDQQQVKNLEQNMSKTSSSSNIGTSFVSILQNILFKQSQGMLISGFLYQKFSFILLIKTILPLPIYKSITSLNEQFPTQQFQFLNIYQDIIHLSYDQYQSEGFQLANISFNALITAGPFITVLIICFFIFFIFNFLIDYFIDTKIQLISKIIYSRLISGTTFQYFQLGLMILIIGVNQQIKGIFYYFDSNNIGAQISLVVILNAVCILIFLILYLNINDPRIIQKNTAFSQINRVSILNGVIFESKMKSNYILFAWLYLNMNKIRSWSQLTNQRLSCFYSQQCASTAKQEFLQNKTGSVRNLEPQGDLKDLTWSEAASHQIIIDAGLVMG
ncbi:hypothetical protein ABPG74_000492 [Tetrahymena malaccensis]